MEHREKVEIIAGILQANEEVLSDGYHFYSGNADKTLAGIAEAILTGIEGGQAADAELLAACTHMNELLKKLTQVAYHDAVKPYLPYGLEEEVTEFVKQSWIDAAIARAQGEA